MENNIFLDSPFSKTIQSPKLINPKKNIKGPLTFYTIKNPQKGSGVMCVEFIVKINYLGILYENSLIPYFSNHLLNSGSSNYNELEISQKLQSLGAHVKFETHRMYSVISVYFLSSQIKPVLSLISNFILSPTYPSKVIKDRVNNEKKAFLINVERLSVQSSRLIKKALYGESHPYGRMTLASDFDNIKSEDLINFHTDLYNSDNVEITISGDFSEDILDLTSFYFSKINASSLSYKSKEKNIFNKNNNILLPPFMDSQSIYSSKDNALQTAFRIAKILPGPNHIDFFALRILITIFGGYFGSRLMTNIREEKGYTYGIGAYLVVEENYSELHIVTEVGEKYTKLVIDEVIKEMEKLKNQELSKEELEKVKAYLLGSLLHSCDGIFNQSILFRNLKKHNSSFQYIDLFIDEIRIISQKKIKELANKYFNVDNFSFVACGPPKRKLW